MWLVCLRFVLLPVAVSKQLSPIFELLALMDSKVLRSDWVLWSGWHALFVPPISPSWCRVLQASWRCSDGSLIKGWGCDGSDRRQELLLVLFLWDHDFVVFSFFGGAKRVKAFTKALKLNFFKESDQTFDARWTAKPRVLFWKSKVVSEGKSSRISF